MHTLDDLRAGRLGGATRLDLRAGLTEFPSELFQLAETLEILDLSGNRLESLPDELPRLHRLRILFCSGNRFTRLPAVLGRMPNLRLIGFRGNRIAEIPPEALAVGLEWLILTDNRLAELPDAIGACIALRKCALAGNRLRALPAAMAGCTALELLRASANELVELPDWLAELPRLAWVALGGNPLTAAREAGSWDAPPAVPWPELHLEAEIGSGASGIVHRVRHGERLRALKLFKGELTSDGWTRSEIAAASAAGDHVHLIGVDGILVDHPAGAAGVAMPLLAADYRRLADPPSFATCTRDVYAAGLRLTPAQALGIARGVARAVEHLHRRGVLHGDVYAHNIQWDGVDRARLGDFGAATLLSGTALTRCEMRAVGCLLEELAERTVGPLPPKWVALQRSCLDPRPGHRPDSTALAAAFC